MKSLIIGMGEVGSALYKVISPIHETWTKDIDPVYRFDAEEAAAVSGTSAPAGVEVLHICLNYNEDWFRLAKSYVEQIRPKIVNVQTTVPPGTTAMLEKATGIPSVHSTTRGLHPNLEESMRTFVKHIGGGNYASLLVAAYFHKCGLKTHRHATAKTTELAHILSNTLYGANIAFAEEMSRLCRHYGVDYNEAVIHYTQTANEGYKKLGHSSKMRMILTPPHGRIGGHCVVYGANLIPEDLRGSIMQRIAGFNETVEKKHKPEGSCDCGNIGCDECFYAVNACDEDCACEKGIG